MVIVREGAAEPFKRWRTVPATVKAVNATMPGWPRPGPAGRSAPRPGARHHRRLRGAHSPAVGRPRHADVRDGGAHGGPVAAALPGVGAPQRGVRGYLERVLAVYIAQPVNLE